ncbi:amidase [Streptococcus caprae]|uniref:Amidase n=1 Tax=Streptococcus caprae TaxID=1640501 RepID=A0ABV8CSE1_9STRE
MRDATGMAELVRTRQISAKELVEETIEKIERLNPELNAVTSTRYEEALCEADRRDFSEKPFAGVPFLLKDLGQEQAGQLSTSGSRLFQTYRAKSSDNYVKALENLGFIILGRTNTPEFGFKNISDSSLHGVVNLPDNQTRNAGGSSGGAAATVASGILPLAAASDGGGSIRIPASFNGLVGLKPSRGRIPVGPDSFRGWQGASVSFALSQSVRDCRNLLYHLQTCQIESPFVLPELSYGSLYHVKDREFKPLRIAVLKDSPIGSEVSEDARAAVEKAEQFLSDLGHEIVHLSEQPLDGVAAMQAYYLMNSVETAAMFAGIEQSFGRAMTHEDMEPMTWAIYRSGLSIPAHLYSQTLALWDQFSHQMAQFHETYDVLLTPTTADVAPKHGQFDQPAERVERLLAMDSLAMAEQQDLIWEMFADSLALTPFTQQANLTGQPAISLPIYRRGDGLAIGVQLTAAKGREDLLLHLAEEFESANQFR